MESFFSIKLTRQSNVPVYKQLANGLEEMIQKNILKPGTKLPSIRNMSHKLGINDVTVISAYKYLENKNILVSQVGSGTYVSELINGFDLNTNPLEYKPPSNIDVYKAINFSKSTISQHFFSVSEFKHLFNDILDTQGLDAFGFTPNKGHEPLRKYLQNYINFYGVETTYEQIQIMPDIYACINILSKAILNKDDCVLVENPLQSNIINIFKQNLYNVICVPMCKEGMQQQKLEKLIKKYKPKLIYVNTYFQTPTNITYSDKTKEQIINLANKYNIYILEEDRFFELLNNDKPKPLKALDTNDKVILIKNFSKLLPSDLNMCFIILPRQISLLQNQEPGICAIVQKVIELYFKKNYFNNNLMKIKNMLTQKYELMKSAINLHLKDYINYNIPLGGMYFWLEIKNKNISAQMLCEKLLNKNVIVTPGIMYSLKQEDIPYIRLCFADIEDNEIEKGIKIIKNEIEKMLKQE